MARAAPGRSRSHSRSRSVYSPHQVSRERSFPNESVVPSRFPSTRALSLSPTPSPINEHSKHGRYLASSPSTGSASSASTAASFGESTRKFYEASAGLVHTGKLLKKNSKYGWKTYYFVCTEVALQYYDARGQEFPTGYMSTSDILEVAHRDEGRRFDVVLKSRARPYKFMARNKARAKEWVDALRSAISGDVGTKPLPSARRRLSQVDLDSAWVVQYWEKLQMSVSMSDSAPGAAEHRLWDTSYYKAALGQPLLASKLMRAHIGDRDLALLLLGILHKPPRTKNDGKDEIFMMLAKFARKAERGAGVSMETKHGHVYIRKRKQHRVAISDTEFLKQRRNPALTQGVHVPIRPPEPTSLAVMGASAPQPQVHQRVRRTRRSRRWSVVPSRFADPGPDVKVNGKVLSMRRSMTPPANVCAISGSHKRCPTNWQDSDTIMMRAVSRAKSPSGRHVDKKSMPDLSLAERIALFDWMLGPNTHVEATESIRRVLYSPIPRVREAVLRLLWTLVLTKEKLNDRPSVDSAATRFSTLLQSTFPRDRTSMNHVRELNRMLLEMLTASTQELSNPVRNLDDVSGKLVVQPQLWRAVFKNLEASHLFPRTHCLKEINFLLINRPANIESLLRQRDWPSWLLPLLFDIPLAPLSAGGSTAPSVSRARNYTMNIFVQLLEHAMLTYSVAAFATEIRRSIVAILSPFTGQSAQVSRVLLSAFCTLLTSNIQRFSLQPAAHAARLWGNVLHFVKLVQVMVFAIPSKYFYLPDTTVDEWRTHDAKSHVEYSDKILVYWKHLLNHSQNHQNKTFLRVELKRFKCQATGSGTSATTGTHSTGSGLESTDVLSSPSGGVVSGSDPPDHHSTPATSASSSAVTSKKSTNSVGSEVKVSAVGPLGSNSTHHIQQTHLTATRRNVRLRREVKGSKSLSPPHSSPVPVRRRKAASRSERNHSLAMFDSLMAYGLTKAAVAQRKTAVMDLKKDFEKNGQRSFFGASDTSATAKLELHGQHWREGLPGDIALVSKVAKLVSALMRRYGNEDVKDRRLASVRGRLFREVPFLHDATAFLSIVREKQQRIPAQMLAGLLRQFVGSSDDARKKIFKSFEAARLRHEARVSRELDAYLALEKSASEDAYKILLLGPGESGKSTIFKQTIINYGKGLPRAKCAEFANDVYHNIVSSLLSLVWHSTQYSTAFVLEDEKRFRESGFVITDSRNGTFEDILAMLMERKQYDDFARLAKHRVTVEKLTHLKAQYIEKLQAATLDVDDQERMMDILQVQAARQREKANLLPPQAIVAWLNEWRKMFKISKSAQVTAAVRTLQSLNHTVHRRIRFSQQVGDAADIVWKDIGIQNTFARRAEFRRFQIQDSAPYFNSKAREIGRLNGPPDPKRGFTSRYTPTVEDVLFARKRTAGVVEERFKIGEQAFRIIDVAGQRGERKKWVSSFSGVTAVIYVSSLNGYDQYLAEDAETLRIHESIDLFREICDEEALSRATKILFLNKLDLFLDKIKKVPITVAFPEYKNDPHDENAAMAYIREQFLKAAGPRTRNELFVYFTCATDQAQVVKILRAVTTGIIRSALSTVGLV